MNKIIFAAKIFTNAILLALIFGCVNMQQMQNGMNEIDSFWGEVNHKILSSKGTRVFSCKTINCWNAAKDSAIQLGFKVIEESNNSIFTALALTPTPFTVDEYKAIRVIEEPMMQAIAANHVGKFYSNFYQLDNGGNFYIVARVQITPMVNDKSSVQISFRIDPKEKSEGFIYGHNPPPESVRMGLEKWWNAFEKNLAQNSM